MIWPDERRNFTASAIQRGVRETTTQCIREDDASDLIIDRCCAVMVFVTMMVMSLQLFSVFVNNK